MGKLRIFQWDYITWGFFFFQAGYSQRGDERSGGGEGRRDWGSREDSSGIMSYGEEGGKG